MSHRPVATHSTERTARLPLDAQYDVVVIGGGAGGLGGALALVRSSRSVLVVDDGQPRNAPAAQVHNYLTRDGTPPQKLLAAGRVEVVGYGGQIINERVVSITRVEHQEAHERFQVLLQNGNSVHARRLLVATGLVDELPSVPGVRERWGRDVLHCPYCHGWEVRNQAIGVLATGPMTVHQALLFRQLSGDVVVFQHTAPALSEEQREQLAARGVAVIPGEVVALEVRDDRLVGVRLRTSDVIARQALVVAPRFVARAELLATLGLQTTNLEVAGCVIATSIAADANGATSVPGVWVAGNAADPSGQVISAAAGGLKAGAHINADLVAEDTARAVAALRAKEQS